MTNDIIHIKEVVERRNIKDMGANCYKIQDRVPWVPGATFSNRKYHPFSQLIRYCESFKFIFKIPMTKNVPPGGVVIEMKDSRVMVRYSISNGANRADESSRKGQLHNKSVAEMGRASHLRHGLRRGVEAACNRTLWKDIKQQS